MLLSLFSKRISQLVSKTQVFLLHSKTILAVTLLRSRGLPLSVPSTVFTALPLVVYSVFKLKLKYKIQ